MEREKIEGREERKRGREEGKRKRKGWAGGGGGLSVELRAIHLRSAWI